MTEAVTSSYLDISKSLTVGWGWGRESVTHCCWRIKKRVTGKELKMNPDRQKEVRL